MKNCHTRAAFGGATGCQKGRRTNRKNILNLDIHSDLKLLIGLATAAIALAWSAVPTRAEDAAAQFTVALFDQVCVQNFGHLDRVGDWALDRDLAPITNPLACRFSWATASCRPTRMNIRSRAAAC